MKESLIEFKNNEGKITGHLRGDTYYSDRRPTHFYRKWQSFGISQHILSSLEKNGCSIIRIDYYGIRGLVQLKCPLSQYLESNLICNDSGDDEQKHVPMKAMKEI